VDARHTLEDFKLVLDVGYVHSEVGGDVDEGKVDGVVAFRVDSVHVHAQALSLIVPALEIGDVELPGWRGALDNVHTAVANACIWSVISSLL
jgi:hypothetical protein